MLNTYYYLKVIIQFKEDIKLKDSGMFLSKVVATAMCKSEALQILHNANEFKNYVLCLPYPIPKQDKLYKKDTIYAFDIRSTDLSFLLRIKNALRDSGMVNVVAIEQCNKQYRLINELTTLTPAVITKNDGKNWVVGDDIKIVINSLHNNLVKKMKELYPEFEEPNEVFVAGIELLNRVPISINYKNTKILANKFKIIVKTDEASQRLAFLGMATGVLEKNSVGCGYCMAR